jgi:uncharacterized protein (TIGR03083 family)
VSQDDFPLPPLSYLQPLESEMAAFAAIIARHDAATPVAIHPRWQLRGLASHLGGIHRWAAETVALGTRARHVPKLPDDADPAAWYSESASQLLGELRQADPESRCWNFSSVPRTRAFWFRRQLHETVIHGRDADLATGELRPVDALLAADGVDEVLRTMLPVGHRWGGHAPPPRPGPVVIELSDTGHSWRLTPGGGAVPDVTGPRARTDGPVTSTVTGTAQDVLLALWQRASLDTIDITGDARAVADLLAGQITP